MLAGLRISAPELAEEAQAMKAIGRGAVTNLRHARGSRNARRPSLLPRQWDGPGGGRVTSFAVAGDSGGGKGAGDLPALTSL
jgi:hypothetical protein